MELKQLLYFKTVADCGNMSAAAEKLNISQPALSTAVKKLEEELKTRLFDREKSKISVNDAGRLALTYAEAILGKSEEMRKTFHTYIRQDRLLVLAFSDPGPMRLSVPLFQKAHPQTDVSAELLADENNLENLLLEHKYDAIISIRRPEHPEIITLPFAREKLLLSVPASHPWAKRKSVCLEREQGEQMAVYCGEGAYIRQLEPFLKRTAQRHLLKIYDDYFVFRQLLEQKDMLTLTTRLVSQYRHDGDGRVIIPLEDKGIAALYLLSFAQSGKRLLSPWLEWAKDTPALRAADDSTEKQI